MFPSGVSVIVCQATNSDLFYLLGIKIIFGIINFFIINFFVIWGTLELKFVVLVFLLLHSSIRFQLLLLGDASNAGRWREECSDWWWEGWSRRQGQK